MSALLPQDQIFDPEDLEYDHKNHEEHQPQRKRIKSERKFSETKINPDDASENIDIVMKQEDAASTNWDIDNPYLAATKLPVRNE